MTTINRTITFVDQQCINCGCFFALEKFHYNELRKYHHTFYCPNGHGQIFTAKSDAEKLQELLDRERSARLAAEDQAQAAERSRAAIQGQLTKARRKIANGVCPECHRHFENVERHMKSKHAALVAETQP